MGDKVEIDFEAGALRHNDAEYRFPPLPLEALAILEDGGPIPHLKKVLVEKQAPGFAALGCAD